MYFLISCICYTDYYYCIITGAHDGLLIIIIIIIIIITSIDIISNGNRTEWSPIRSAIIRVINKIGPRSGSPICLITVKQLIITLTKFVMYKLLFLKI